MGGLATISMRTGAWVTLAVALEGTRAFGQVSPAGAEQNRRLSYGLEADFNSGYVWRGIAFSNQPMMQPSVWVERSGLTLTAWRNFVLGREPSVAHLRVTDLNLAYSRGWKKLTIEPSLDAFLNQRPPGVQDPNTMEGSLRLSYPAGPLRVFTAHSVDVLAYQGAYFGEAGRATTGRSLRRLGSTFPCAPAGRRRNSTTHTSGSTNPHSTSPQPRARSPTTSNRDSIFSRASSSATLWTGGCVRCCPGPLSSISGSP